MPRNLRLAVLIVAASGIFQMKKTKWLMILLVFFVPRMAFGNEPDDVRSWSEAILAASGMLQQGHFEEARRILVETLLKVQREESGGPRSIVTMNNLGIACQALGRYTEAEQWYCKALHLLEKNRPGNLENKFRQLNNLTSLYLFMGQLDKAQKMQGRILKLKLGTLGSPNPDVARQYEHAATISRAHHRLAEAEGWCRRALAAWQSLVGPTSPKIAALLNNLGVIFLDKGDYNRALDYFLQSIKMWEEASGEDHPGLAEPLLNVGRIHLLKREPDLADSPLARALLIAEAAFGGTYPLVGQILHEQAAALKERGRDLQAADLFRRARAIFEEQTRNRRYSHGVDINQLLMDQSK